MGFLRWGLASALCVALGAVAVARPAAPRIDGVDVERVPALEAGARLNFSVFGTPGGSVVLRIAGVPRDVVLQELQPGVYDGSLVIEPEDRISTDAQVVATLQLHGQVARSALQEPLVLGAERVAAQEQAPFPAPRPAPLPAPLPTPLPAPVEAPARAPLQPPMHAPLPPPAPAMCERCAIVESIRAVDGPRDTLPNTPGRALITHLFGEQGEAQVARWFGNVGRAFSGRPAPSGTAWEVQLRLPSGEHVDRRYDTQPPFRVGDMLVLGSTRSGEAIRSAP